MIANALIPASYGVLVVVFRLSYPLLKKLLTDIGPVFGTKLAGDLPQSTTHFLMALIFGTLLAVIAGIVVTWREHSLTETMVTILVGVPILSFFAYWILLPVLIFCLVAEYFLVWGEYWSVVPSTCHIKNVDRACDELQTTPRREGPTRTRKRKVGRSKLLK